MINVKHGMEYIHKTWGRVLMIYSHPHDGACLIVERCAGLEDDGPLYDICESSDLQETELQGQWPYLGFTAKPK